MTRPPVFRFVQVYNNRDARVHLHGLAFHSRPPHRNSALVHLRMAAHLRFTDCSFSADDDESDLPAAVYAATEVTDLTFERCRIRGTGIGIAAGAERFVVRDCELSDLAGSALMIGHNGRDVLLEGNYIHHQRPRIVRLFLVGPRTVPVQRGDRLVQEETGAEGVVYSVREDRIEVTPPNKVRILFAPSRAVRQANGAEALGPLTDVLPSDLSHGSGLSIRCSDLTARNNVIHNYGSTAAIFVYPNSAVPRHAYRNITIENNLIFDPLTRHVVVNQPGENIVVRNNTVPHGDIQFYPAEGRDLSGVTVVNNICTGLLSMTAESLPTLRASYNIVHWVMSRQPRQTHRSFDAFPGMWFVPEDDAGRRAFAELFVDFEARDFRLREGGRAVGFGMAGSAPATDLRGQARRDPPDAGALAIGGDPVRLTPPLGPMPRTDWRASSRQRRPYSQCSSIRQSSSAFRGR
jgi:hypothetical protein